MPHEEFKAANQDTRQSEDLKNVKKAGFKSTHEHTHAKLLPSCPTPCYPMDCQAPLFMEFSREGYWSAFLCCPPGDLPNPGIEPECPALAD